MKNEIVNLATKCRTVVERKEAIDSLQKALFDDDKWLLGYQLLLQVKLIDGQIDEVIDIGSSILRRFINDPVLLALKAEAMLIKGDKETGLEIYLQAAKYGPTIPSINYNCANTLKDLNRIDESIKYYKVALSYDKNNVDILLNLGAAYQDLANYKDAEKLFRKVNSLSPELASAYINLAQIRYSTGEHKSAKALIEHALTLSTITAEAKIWAKVTLSNILIEEKRPELAFNILNNLLSTENFDYYYIKSYFSAALKYCDIKVQDFLGAEVAKYEESDGASWKKESIYDQFNLLACSKMTPELLLKSALRKSTRIKKPINVYTHKNRTKNERLRIGYLTADFRDHPVAHLMLGVMKSHDRTKFEVFAYDLGPDNFSLYRYKGIQYVDHYKSLHGKPAERIAEYIYQDNIDVLIDLVGYTEFCQPKIIMHRPAPVQINYLGFVGTTGLGEHDYIIADKVVLPENEQPYYIERPIYLPRCYQATDGTLEYEKLTRSCFGLPEDAFVFGSFNNSYKLNVDFIKKTSSILKRCPNSILWLYANDAYTKNNLLKAFRDFAIDKSRIFFYERGDKSRFLAALSNMNLFLDSSPYNAGTTASDSLYAGCPVLTHPGRTYSSRMAASILFHSDLRELIADSEDEYTETAIRMYSDLDFRNHILNKTKNSKNSRLFDTVDASRCLEMAYLEAYNNFLNQKLCHIYIDDYEWQYGRNSSIKFAGSYLTHEDVDVIKKKIHESGLPKRYLDNLKRALKPVYDI